MADTTAYPKEATDLAASRGYVAKDHEAALAADPTASSDDVALTHPTNWLTEDEVTRLWDTGFDTGFVYPAGAAWKDLEDESNG